MSSRDEKIKDLRENPPSIISPNCWGGLTYHHLGLKFMSPFINMWETHDEYLMILENLRHYLEEEPELIKMYDGDLCAPYPIVSLGDVVIKMNHYRTIDEAMECWERRKKRIRWDNLIVMLWDEDIDRIKRFMSLPYEKKICFAPFDSGIDGVIEVPYRQYEHLKDMEFWQIMNNLAQGKYVYYDDLSLIHDLEFKKTGDFEFDPEYLTKR